MTINNSGTLLDKQVRLGTLELAYNLLATNDKFTNGVDANDVVLAAEVLTKFIENVS